MQLISGRLHTVFPMGDPTRVGEARRHAARLASLARLDETAAGRLAIVVNELGSNLVRHAKKGQLLLAASDGEVEIVSIDSGPGMSDVQRHIADGYSTGGTPGTGLGAIGRLSQDFDMHSREGEGTIIVARIRNDAAKTPSIAMRIGAIATAAPGESVSGDAWAALVDASSTAIVVADGLGHGAPAEEAAAEMVQAFRDVGPASTRDLFGRAHMRLRATRGAAVSMLKLDSASRKISCAGAGNVLARIVSGTSDRTLVTQHGTVGVQMRDVHEATYEWPPHAVVVLYTDGVESRWPAQKVAAVLARDPVVLAAIVWRDHCRGRDDATVVVATRAETR